MPPSESEGIFKQAIETIPADDKYCQVFLQVDEDPCAVSRVVRVIETSGARLQALSVLPSPLTNKKIVMLKFNHRELQNVVIDFFQAGYLEVKGCGPRLIPEMD